MLNDIKYLYLTLPYRYKLMLLTLILLMVFGLLLEIFSIALILPFLAVMSDIALLENYGLITDFIHYLAAVSGFTIPLVVTVIFVGFSIFNGMSRMFLLWFNLTFIYKIGARVGQTVFETLIVQPLSFHIENNSSISLGATRKVDYAVDTVIKPLLQGLASFIFAVGILTLMVYVAPEATLLFSMVALSYYLLVSFFFKRRLNNISKRIDANETKRILYVQEAIGSIRDVIIDKKHQFFISRFARKTLS